MSGTGIDTDRETAAVALWAANLAAPLAGIADWLAAVETRLTEAAADGADVLVLPEYVSEHWLAYAPAGLAPTEEVAFMAEEGAKAAARLPDLVARHGVALVAGSFPVAAPGRDPDGPAHVNRATLYLPDGRAVAQDKLCLTPNERDPAGWSLNTGTSVQVVDWNGLRLAVVICLDIELPALAARLAAVEPGIDLVLVPSITETRAGYERVFACARARAVELMAAVCPVGAIGSVAPDGSRPNHSGAAVYLPCEPAFGHHGRLAEVPGRGTAVGAGPLLAARDIPVGKLRRLRAGEAAVWPGAWDAGHVEITG